MRIWQPAVAHALATCGLVVCSAVAARAQYLPADPIVVGNGAITLGGDVSAAIGTDDPGFFNYTDYQYSSLRKLRLALTGAAKAGDHLSLLGEVRVETVIGEERLENTGRPEASALYLRIRPWTRHAIDIQAGRIPPTFGAFARRTYGSDNPLIGYPLGYQYLTSLRPDAVPANADDLLRMRGRGWLSSFPVGNTVAKRGVPLASAFRWDTGVQVHAEGSMVDATAAVTVGTLANPLVKDDNSGRQTAGRLAVHPVPGLIVGASASHGPFLSTGAVHAAGSTDPGKFTQDAWGADAEYSRGQYLVRAEAIVSRWTLPMVSAPFIDRRLAASAISVEGRYKIIPGLFAAARVDHLGFSTITGTNGPRSWDAPVTRVEAGAGYSLQRNLLLKASYQFDRRDTSRVSRSHLTAAEVVFWF